MGILCEKMPNIGEKEGLGVREGLSGEEAIRAGLRMKNLTLKNGYVLIGIGALFLFLIFLGFKLSFPDGPLMCLPLGIFSLCFFTAGSLKLIKNHFPLSGVKETVIMAILLAFFLFIIADISLAIWENSRADYCKQNYASHECQIDPFKSDMVYGTTSPDSGKACTSNADCLSKKCIDGACATVYQSRP